MTEGLQQRIVDVESQIATIEECIKNLRENLAIIDIQISEKTGIDDIPPRLMKSKQQTASNIANLNTKLAELKKERDKLLEQRAQPIPHSTVDAAPSRLQSPDCIQIIGWRGIEPPVLYGRCTFGHLLAFLTTEMSFNTLPPMRFCPSLRDTAREFDVIYIDIEFIERYVDLGRIAVFIQNDRIRNICSSRGPLEPAIRNLVRYNAPKAASKVSCVPIQFGFNEILINKRGKLGEALIDKIERINNGRSEVWSYDDFHLEKLLEDEETKIAVWHWYMPALTHIILSIWAKEIHDQRAVKPEPGKSSRIAPLGDMIFRPAPVSLVARLKEIANWDEQDQDNIRLSEHLAALVAKLRKNPRYRKRIMICESLQEIRDQALDDFQAGILLGIGSSILLGGGYNDVEPVIPIEGVPVWINCAAALHTQSQNVSRAADIIQYWMDDDTQLALFNESKDAKDDGYIGLPVNRNTLSKLHNDASQSCPALDTFDKLFSKETGMFANGMVATRTFPRNVWTQWVGWWESFVKAASMR